MSKKIIIIIAVLLLGGYYALDSQYILTPKTEILTQPPRVLQERNSSEEVYIGEINTGEQAGSTSVSGVLDFNEVYRFNSTEEIGEIRFTMTVGRRYTIQQNYEYSYHGIGTSSGHTGGKVHMKDSSDPEFTTESKFLLQVGNQFAIGFVAPVEGRHFWVTVIEVGPTVLKLRIEEIND